jgi:hypothetical protein
MIAAAVAPSGAKAQGQGFEKKTYNYSDWTREAVTAGHGCTVMSHTRSACADSACAIVLEACADEVAA